MPLPVLLLLALQVLDVAVHVATDQVEAQRIGASVILSAAALVAVYTSARATVVVMGGELIYLALNALFVWQHGLINPATGSVRLPLFLFVILSLMLARWIRRNTAPDA